MPQNPDSARPAVSAGAARILAIAFLQGRSAIATKPFVYIIRHSNSGFLGSIWTELETAHFAVIMSALLVALAVTTTVFAHSTCLLNRTPAPPPFAGINSTPAPSRAFRIAFSVASRGIRASLSKLIKVRTATFATSASWFCDHPSNPRAARHCDAFIILYCRKSATPLTLLLQIICNLEIGQ